MRCRSRLPRYFEDIGTAILNLAVNPVTGEPWVANIESHNLVRFEPELRGHVADHRLARLNRVTGAVASIDLNPGVDYDLLPNAQARESALAEARDHRIFAGRHEDLDCGICVGSRRVRRQRDRAGSFPRERPAELARAPGACVVERTRVAGGARPPLCPEQAVEHDLRGIQTATSSVLAEVRSSQL